MTVKAKRPLTREELRKVLVANCDFWLGALEGRYPITEAERRLLHDDIEAVKFLLERPADG